MQTPRICIRNQYLRRDNAQLTMKKQPLSKINRKRTQSSFRVGKMQWTNYIILPNANCNASNQLKTDPNTGKAASKLHQKRMQPRLMEQKPQKYSSKKLKKQEGFKPSRTFKTSQLTIPKNRSKKE